MGGKLAIYIPAYNEERSIGSVVLSAKKYGRVIVVDDGSIDATARIAESAGAKVVRLRKNGGYGAALQKILEEARQGQETAFVTIDGDYQHNPEEIQKLAEPVLAGDADVAVGSRHLGDYKGASGPRKAGVWLLNNLASFNSGGAALDYECGFRCISRDAARKIRVRQTGYSACTELVSSAVESGLRTISVPVSVRFYGKAKDIGVCQQGAGVVKYLLEEIAQRRPLFFFGLAGAALLLCSALLGSWVVETFYATSVLPVGSALLTLFTGIGGLVMILIGINLYTLEAILKKRGMDD